MSGQTTTTGSVDVSLSLPGGCVRARAALLVVASLALFVATQFGDAAGTARAVAAEPELALLLRAMAGLKAVIAASVIGLIIWRLGSPIGPLRLALYALSTSAMTAGPVLIWTLAHVGSGAALLHGGMLAGLILLWRDPTVGARLQTVIKDRRMALHRHTRT